MTRASVESLGFIIPSTSPTTSPGPSRSKQESIPLGQLDRALYDAAEGGGPGGIGSHGKLGLVTFALVYCDKSEKLKVVLKSVEVTHKPSPTVVGMNWACDPLVTMELLPNTAKKEGVEMIFEAEIIIDVKRGKLNEKTLKVTVFDRKRKHVHIPIGHAIVPLRNVPNIEKMNAHTKNINFHSQPAGHNKGNLLISTMWSPAGQKLEIKVIKASNLKNEYDDNGKEYYVKVISYIGASKHKSFKTQLIKASPELTFQEKFVLALNTAQLKDSSIVFLLYMRNTNKMKMVNKLLCGRTAIGPYMRKMDERNLSQWEKNITNPLEEITENHIIYL